MSDKSSILFLASWYPNQDDPTLGIFIRRHALAVSLYHPVSLLYVRKGAADEITVNRQGNLKEYIIHYKPSLLPGFISYIRAFNKGIKRIFAESDPELIHSHVILPAGFLGARLAKRKAIPHVVTEHWTGYHKEDGSYSGSLMKALTRYTVRNSNIVLPVSEDLKSAMLAHGLSAPYQVVYNVADPVFFKASRKLAKKKFLHVSSLDQRQKNIKGIIDAFRSLLQEVPDATLVIAGDGPNRQQTMAYAKGINGISFPGSLNAEQLAEELSDTTALVLFSEFENLPCVIIESLAAGVPVISSTVGGIGEILTERQGALIRKGDTNQLKAAMIRMLNADPDSKKIQEEARSRFSYEVIGKQISSIYRKLLRK